MKKFLRKHPQAFLVALAIVFLAVIIVSFSWGIGNVVSEVNRGMNVKGAADSSVNFNLQAARQLDYRGLVK